MATIHVANHEGLPEAGVRFDSFFALYRRGGEDNLTAHARSRGALAFVVTVKFAGIVRLAVQFSLVNFGCASV